MSSQQWKSLLRADGGHGMPPGDDVGTQIVLWNFLNMMPKMVRHPELGAWDVVLDATQGVPCDGSLVTLVQGDDQIKAAVFAMNEQWEVLF